jgi:di/tricarboxylate transporter
MLIEHWIVFGTLLLTLVLFITGRWRYDIVALLALLVLTLTGLIPAERAFSGFSNPAVITVAAVLVVSRGLQNSGVVDLIGQQLGRLKGGVTVQLAAVTGLVMVLSDVVNNAAAVVLMAPIGISVAQGLNANVDPFLMAVAIGASCAFLTPIGHQSNTLVMGPGGYKFGDTWRMGLPLEIIVVLVSIPLILLVWPLGV